MMTGGTPILGNLHVLMWFFHQGSALLVCFKTMAYHTLFLLRDGALRSMVTITPSKVGGDAKCGSITPVLCTFDVRVIFASKKCTQLKLRQLNTK